MGGSSKSGGQRALAVCLLASSACSLDFDVGDRNFECPPQVKNCRSCNPDGTCREAAEVIQTPSELRPLPTPPAEPPSKSPAVTPEVPVMPLPLTPVSMMPGPVIGATTRDAGPPPEPQADADAKPPPDPLEPEVCEEFKSRANDSLCVNGGEQCFSLGSVLSPALEAWLDPTTLPRDGSRYWCDRSGQRHHARLVPDGTEPIITADGRAVGAALAGSLVLDGGWLVLSEGNQPALASGNFAVMVAAAAPLEPSDGQAFELFEGGDLSRINLTLVPATGKAEGRITTQQSVLVGGPVVTRSSVYDSSFHLYSLYRRSEVRVLDDVLQLRLNGVLEFRSSSLAIPRGLDQTSVTPPRIGAKTAPNGTLVASRGRVAAVVVLRGSVPEDELSRLENFLCSALDVCAPPAAPPVTPPPVTPPPVTPPPVTPPPVTPPPVTPPSGRDAGP